MLRVGMSTSEFRVFRIHKESNFRCPSYYFTKFIVRVKKSNLSNIHQHTFDLAFMVRVGARLRCYSRDGHFRNSNLPNP